MTLVIRPLAVLTLSAVILAVVHLVLALSITLDRLQIVDPNAQSTQSVRVTWRVSVKSVATLVLALVDSMPDAR